MEHLLGSDRSFVNLSCRSDRTDAGSDEATVGDDRMANDTVLIRHKRGPIHRKLAGDRDTRCQGFNRAKLLANRPEVDATVRPPPNENNAVRKVIIPLPGHETLTF